MRSWNIYTLIVSLVAFVSVLFNIKLLQDRVTSKNITFTVVDVLDGDTFTIESAGETRRVRLIGVDTPETGKCLSKEAKNTLSNLIEDKDVVLEDQFTDPYGRIMANVYAGDKYINKEMLALGMGRMDYYEHPRREQLKTAYAVARGKKRGIFSQKCISRTPPVSTDSTVLCDVKGNIDDNTQKKIYFLPDCNNYSQVTIDLSTDDQWFCSEGEAIQAGFAKSTTCK